MVNSDSYGTRARILNNYLSEWLSRGYIQNGRRLDFYDLDIIRRVNRADAKELRDAETYMRRAAGGYGGAYARTKNTRFASLRNMILKQREAVMKLLQANNALEMVAGEATLAHQSRIERDKINLVSNILRELSKNWGDTKYYSSFSKLFIDINRLIHQLEGARRSISVVDLEYSVYASGEYFKNRRLQRRIRIDGLKIVRVGSETPHGLDDEYFWRNLNNRIRADVERESDVIVERLMDAMAEKDLAFVPVYDNFVWSVGSDSLPSSGGVLRRDATR